MVRAEHVPSLFRILEKAEILYHAGRFRLAWDEVRATLNRFDEINFENEKALAGCERPFRLDPGDLLASYVSSRLRDHEVKSSVLTLAHVVVEISRLTQIAGLRRRRIRLRKVAWTGQTLTWSLKRTYT
jgi:hypothetical protein